MSNRIKSVNIMRALQPFLQGGILSPANAKKMMENYIAGNEEELKAFTTSIIPVGYMPAMENLKRVLNEKGVRSL